MAGASGVVGGAESEAEEGADVFIPLHSRESNRLRTAERHDSRVTNVMGGAVKTAARRGHRVRKQPTGNT